MGVRPLAADKRWMILILACNMAQTGSHDTSTCGKTQLYAGTQAGIEGNLHSVCAIWPQSSGWTIYSKGVLVEEAAAARQLVTQLDEEATTDPNAGTYRAADNPRVDQGTDPDAIRSRCVDKDGFG